MTDESVYRSQMPPLGVKPWGFVLSDRAQELHRALHEYNYFYYNRAQATTEWKATLLTMAGWAEELAENLRAQVGKQDE